MTSTIRRFTVIIPGIPPTLNEYRRQHPMQQYREKQDWQVRTMGAFWDAYGATVKPTAMEKARVTATFHYPDRRRRDPDGAAASLKGVLDGLVAVGLLADDDFDHVELVVRRGEPDKARPRVEVLVEEVG
jgi:crossover junction endodeoxyribonuclease RusA